MWCSLRIRHEACRPLRPIGYLKSHAAEIAKKITETGEPILITQNGVARPVIMDVSSHEQKEQTLALLKMLAMGQRDIEQGHYRDAEVFFCRVGQGRSAVKAVLLDEAQADIRELRRYVTKIFGEAA